MISTAVPGFATLDLVRLLFGVLITAAGMVAVLLFLLRIRRKEYAQLYFGLSASLYGIRLFIEGSAGHLDPNRRVDLLITLVAGIPFTLFIAETAGSRWKKPVHWIIGGMSLAAVYGIVRVFLHHDYGVRIINHITVLVLGPVILVLLFIPFRSHDRDVRVLRIGFLVFLLFVIYTNLVDLRKIPGNGGLELIGFVFFIVCLGLCCRQPHATQ